MVKVQQNNQSNAIFVIIPKAIAEAMGLTKGTEVDFKLNEKGELVIKKK
jgi:AbrB family looped-hinge helix DNA binding protein